MVTTLEKNNPISIKNERTKALDEAYKTFSAIIDEYSKIKNLNEEDIKELKQLIDDAYLDRKLGYYLESKLNNLGDYLEFSLISALSQQTNKQDNSFSKLFYLRHTKQLLSNERKRK